MEISVMKKQGNIVQVNTEFGCFEGTWCSSMPAELKKYVVELDSEDVITPSAIEHSMSLIPKIECDGKNIYFTGIVEEIQDHIMFLRFQGFIIMLELLSTVDFGQYLGQYVRVKLNHINIYDTEIY